MTVRFLQGDVLAMLATLPADHFDCAVTSPPYWGLRDYGVAGQLGLEPTLAEHLAAMVAVFAAVKRVLKPQATLWLNYGDCYATSPNGRSAADTKATGNDDRTFRDKPFSTIGVIDARRNGGVLKAKDLCMVPNRLAIALQDAGWWVRSEIVWGKSNPMPDSSGRYRPSTAHEKIFLLTKSAKSFYDHESVKLPAVSVGPARPAGWASHEGAHGTIHKGGREGDADKQDGHSRRHAGFNARWDAQERGRLVEVSNGYPGSTGDGVRKRTTVGNKLVDAAEGRLLRNYESAPLEVWRMATKPFKGAHFATFPPELVERALTAGCPPGGHVLDPFGGAGTVGLVADRLGRDATLIELNPAYVEIARDRIGPTCAEDLL